jgi:hypothetical protein
MSVLQLRKVQEDPITRKADVRAMARAMDSNTIALVGSCPQVRPCHCPLCNLWKCHRICALTFFTDVVLWFGVH